MPEEVALPELDAEGAQVGGLLLGLDALGDQAAAGGAPVRNPRAERRDEDEEEGQDMRSITTMAFSLRGVRAAWWDAPDR
jgi:hypothetical protein